MPRVGRLRLSEGAATETTARQYWTRHTDTSKAASMPNALQLRTEALAVCECAKSSMWSECGSIRYCSAFSKICSASTTDVTNYFFVAIWIDHTLNCNPALTVTHSLLDIDGSRPAIHHDESSKTLHLQGHTMPAASSAAFCRPSWMRLLMSSTTSHM